MIKPFCFLAAALALNAAPATAEISEAESFIARVLLATFVNGNGSTIEDMTAYYIGTFRQFDIDGVPGLSMGDVERKTRVARVEARAGQIVRWLRMDYDGDFIVTDAEMRDALRDEASRPLVQAGVQITPTDEQIDAVLDALVARQIGEADKNGDRALSLAEMRDEADRIVAETNRVRNDPFLTAAIALDPNGDGTLTLDEIKVFVEAVVNSADIDANGFVTEREQRTTQELYANGEDPRELPRGQVPGPAPANP